jgi:hypothetical protein
MRMPQYLLRKFAQFQQDLSKFIKVSCQNRNEKNFINIYQGLCRNRNEKNANFDGAKYN